ncbi:hypothetical protein ABT56_18895 [Photobacterium aquae]|uniref:Uncharacterized protein n=2 Tax=Photobacterium aquae TaxID=1195763 RepID=A0A0J1GUU6_9GAMM|nr:hypothetical protein ABT56_18895 [Photobacterium aquae]
MKYSKPYLLHDLTVYTDGAIRLTNFYVPKVLNSLFQLDVVLYYIANEEMAKKANEKANELLDRETDRVMKLLDGANDMVKKKSLTDNIEYSMSFAKKYKLQTPLAGKFIKLIQSVDQFNRALDVMWLNGELDSQSRVKRLKRLNASLLNLSGTLYNIGINALKVAQEQGHGEDIESTLKENNVVVDKKQMTEEDLEADSAVDLQPNSESEVAAIQPKSSETEALVIETEGVSFTAGFDLTK